MKGAITMPRISVILPIYNASEFLYESLESLSNQTYTDFEIIAIDDGSTDNSLDLLEDYAKKEHRLRIISRYNKGITKTLNEGIELANGEYIARMDSDDISFPLRFEKQLKFLEENNLDICGSQYQAFGSKSEISNMPIKSEDCYVRLLLGFCIAHPSFLIKKSIISKYRYNENFKYSQDYELCCRMALDKIKMGNTPDILLKYRFSENQISSAKKITQISLAQSIGKNYWLKSGITKDISYPICTIDSLNNNLNDLKDSMYSLIKLSNKLNCSTYMNDFLLSRQLVLLARLSVYGLKTMLPILNHIPNLGIKSKYLYSFMALTRAMKIKEFVKKHLNDSLKEKINKFLYTK